eukprot:CAMPEP_0184728540 /NCGR_PEP_ID=MMETSP0314-20130426/40631_1 /TAXON_ID=38298 /ORGANISM="Rhodella maculata, Strain CCMP 736" /LENGTH=176 /DNA_ID=CAMNT_0027194395 /DNA_START=158 /DNA_END=684 /DNA_ORIENTATION=+
MKCFTAGAGARPLRPSFLLVGPLASGKSSIIMSLRNKNVREILDKSPPLPTLGIMKYTLPALGPPSAQQALPTPVLLVEISGAPTHHRYARRFAPAHHGVALVVDVNAPGGVDDAAMWLRDVLALDAGPDADAIWMEVVPGEPDRPKPLLIYLHEKGEAGGGSGSGGGGGGGGGGG